MQKKAKLSRSKKQSERALPLIDNSPFNQTIISNPRNHINYVHEAAHSDFASINATHRPAHFDYSKRNKGVKQETENCFRGFDAWSFNKNLKQFSETRQLGFYKGEKSRSKNQPSPYLLPKTKTQDLNSYHKLTSYAQNFKNHNRTITTLKKDTLDSDRPHHFNIDCNRKLRAKKYQDRNTTQTTAKQIHSQHTIVPINTFTNKQRPSNTTQDSNKMGDKNSHKKNITARHAFKHPNCFSTVSRNQNVPPHQNEKYHDYDEHSARHRGSAFGTQHMVSESETRRSIEPQQSLSKHSSEDQLFMLAESPLLGNCSPVNRGRVSPNRRNKGYQRSIEQISDCLLKGVDSYFDHHEVMQIPSSQLELYTSTIHQPALVDSSKCPSSVTSQLQTGQLIGGYDFDFEDQAHRKTDNQKARKAFQRKRIYEKYK